MTQPRILALAMLICAALGNASVRAEPYMAIHTGTKCMACHVNLTGGGMRTPFGNIFGQTALPARIVQLDPGSPSDKLWDGKLNKYFGLGGNLRTGYYSTQTPNQSDQSAFRSDEALVYLEAQLLPNRLTLYVDEQVGPGTALNREAFALLWLANQTAYLKVGRMFLPYGWRLEDDSAFIRSVTGINYNTPDNGMELGLEHGPWTVNLAITNGTAGGPETNKGKQLSFLSSFVQPSWRIGASANFNDGDKQGDRTMGNVFLGLKTGIIGWLFEADYLKDETVPFGRKKTIGLVEANAWLAKGHILKLTGERLDPDRDVDQDEQTRASLVWEYFPFQFSQVRTGLRKYSGIPQNDTQNRKEAFVQLHVFF